MLLLQDLKPLLLIVEVVLGIVERLRRRRSPCRRAACCKSYWRRILARSVSAWLRSRKLVLRVCVERQFLAAHIVELLLDLGLLLERRELQLGIGQDREQLALR